MTQIKYEIDPCLFQQLMNKIEQKDNEIRSLKLALESNRRMDGFINTINDPPKYILLDNAYVDLTLAIHIKVKENPFYYHVIGKILHDEGISYSYYVDKQIPNDIECSSLEMVFLNMHKELIKEILEQNKKRKDK